MEIVYARIRLFQLVELVVVRGKERLGPHVVGGVVYVLDYGSGYRDAVISGRSTSQFVKEYQRTLAQVVDDGCGFVHLNHEGGLAQRDVVTCTYTRKNLVNHTYTGAVGRHKAAYLRHQDIERRLSQQCRLTGHIGPGNHQNLRIVVVHTHAIGDIWHTYGQAPFDDGMSSLNKVKFKAVVHHRACVAVSRGRRIERQQAVQPRHQHRIGLHSRNIR